MSIGFNRKSFIILISIILCVFSITFAKDSNQNHNLIIKISEPAQNFPKWQHKILPIECVRFDFLQDGLLKKILFADMRTKRSPDWPADCNIVPYEFVLELSENKSLLEAGNCTITASIWGYSKWQKEIALERGGRTELDVCLSRDPYFGMIVSPRLMTGLTCLREKKFTIEVNAPPCAENWDAFLSSEYFSFPLKIYDKKYGKSQIRNNTGAGWKLTVQANSKTAEDLYDLNIYCSTGKSTQPKAVRILKELPDTFYIAGNFHHALDLVSVSPDNEIADLFTDTVNIINPVFYANVEDVGYEDERIWGRISYCLIKYLNVPYYHGLGNHDRGKAASTKHYDYKPVPDESNSIEYYKYYCGMLYQSRDIGDRLHVVLPYCPDQWTIHNPRPQQQQWIKADLLAHKRSDMRLITCAHLIWGQSSKDSPYELTDLLDKKYRLNLVLADDFHRPQAMCGSVPTFFGGLAKSPKLDEIGILEISKNKNFKGLNECETYFYGNNHVRYYKIKKFDLQFSAPNDGTKTVLTATIIRSGGNQEIIKNGRIRFVLKKGSYSANGGKIYQQIDSSDGGKTIVDIETDIGYPSTEVTVFPKS
ncbi:MAG: hypothetical protein A2Y10_00325 [Planctomycetes bacterium GWF2_41_51]|nr:MAG: hypothetical protein A2Y10_00325 [Planctomycetes bacterium GWF2_41_51]